MKSLLITLLVLAYTTSSFSQDGKINYNEVQQDSIFIANIMNALKKTPANILQVVPQYNNRAKKNLGYGYSLLSGVIARNDILFTFLVIVNHEKMVGYQLTPHLPYEERLTSKYRLFYSKFFKIRSNNEIEPYQFNYGIAIKPTNQFKPTTSDKYFRYLMSPYPGTMYGGRGGYSGAMLANRALFEKVKKTMKPAACEELLYSINPATRLFGIEYYQQHRNLFLPNKTAIERRIDDVLKETPSIETLSGCIQNKQKARELLAYYAANPVR